jgi:hypothetical protein
MKKKAQMTIFIIIIIVLVTAISAFFYMKNKTQVLTFSANEDVNLKDMSAVKIYVEDTIRRLFIDGLFLIGRQGGKIYEDTYPDCQEEDPTYDKEHRMCLQKGIFKYFSIEDYRPKYLSSSPYIFKRLNVAINDSRGPPDDQWTVSGEEPLQQPYAYPHYGPNHGVDYLYGMQDPIYELTDFSGEHTITNQLNLWIKSQLPTELDFRELEKRGFDIILPSTEPIVSVKINEDDVIVLVNYTIDVTRNLKRSTVSEYFVEIDYNFNRFYTFLNRIIQADIYTRDNIIIYTMLNESGEIISNTTRFESNPPNYKYDVIKVADLSYDWTILQNYDQQYFKYSFIRENRAPDAATVKYFPNPHIATVGLLNFECPNFKTAGSWFDPDEDDEYTGEFPFTNPQWYQWYSRGDKLETHLSRDYKIPGFDGDAFYGSPIADKIVYSNMPDNNKYGPDWTSQLSGCGNSQLIKSMGTKLEDVGDIIILKVGDQMDFPIGDKVPAPTNYPDSPIIEAGFGRTNDVISFRPVQCLKGQNLCGDRYEPCGDDGYWLFNKKPQPKYEQEYCIETCVMSNQIDCTPNDDDDNCLYSGSEPYKCEPDARGEVCSKTKIMTKHVNEIGECVDYPHVTSSTPSHNYECAELPAMTEDLCPNGKINLWEAPNDPIQDPVSPSDNAVHKAVCCADAEGVCQDFLLPKVESQCGSYHPDWTYITEQEICNEQDECTVGCCQIRGQDQPFAAQKYECAALCRDAGVCDCPSDLASCVGDFSWNTGQCDGSYQYVEPEFETRIVR